MKIYTLYSDSHKILFDEWFRPSIKATNSDLQLICKISEQFCSSGNYMEKGWKETMIEKDNYIIQSLEDAKPNEIIIHTDVDVQFFKNIKENLDLSIFDTFDIVCQADAPNAACFGFMIMKNTKNLKQMFKNIVEIINFISDNLPHQKILELESVKSYIEDYNYYTSNSEKQLENSTLNKFKYFIYIYILLKCYAEALFQSLNMDGKFTKESWWFFKQTEFLTILNDFDIKSIMNLYYNKTNDNNSKSSWSSAKVVDAVIAKMEWLENMNQKFRSIPGPPDSTRLAMWDVQDALDWLENDLGDKNETRRAAEYMVGELRNLVSHTVPAVN